MSTHAHLDEDLRALLVGWSAPTEAQEQLRQDYLAHLDTHEDASAKAGPPAHFTASCLVVDEAGERVLLTLHRKVGRWLQFGGHIEASDASVADHNCSVALACIRTVVVMTASAPRRASSGPLVSASSSSGLFVAIAST